MSPPAKAKKKNLVLVIFHIPNGHTWLPLEKAPDEFEASHLAVWLSQLGEVTSIWVVLQYEHEKQHKARSFLEAVSGVSTSATSYTYVALQHTRL